jgi:hypothetical protein
MSSLDEGSDGFFQATIATDNKRRPGGLWYGAAAALGIAGVAVLFAPASTALTIPAAIVLGAAALLCAGVRYVKNLEIEPNDRPTPQTSWKFWQRINTGPNEPFV